MVMPVCSCTYLAHGVSPRFAKLSETLPFNVVYQVSVVPAKGLSLSAVASASMAAEDAVSVEVAAVEEAEPPQPASVAPTIVADMPSASARLRVLCFSWCFSFLFIPGKSFIGKHFPVFVTSDKNVVQPYNGVECVIIFPDILYTFSRNGNNGQLCNFSTASK